MRSTRRIGRLVGGFSLLIVGMALATSAGGAAFGAGGTTTASVAVNSTITLSALPATYSMSGDPSSTAYGGSPVTLDVRTNNHTGYTVTVQAAAPLMVGQRVGNTDTIPVSSMKVRETGGGSYTSLSSSSAVTVHSQATRSAGNGDTISTEYQMNIPFVNDDTYTIVLNYVAATQ